MNIGIQLLTINIILAGQNLPPAKLESIRICANRQWFSALNPRISSRLMKISRLPYLVESNRSGDRSIQRFYLAAHG